jgi:hypothetical protein
MHPGTKASIANAAYVIGTRTARLWQQLKPGHDRPNGIIHPEVLLYSRATLPQSSLKEQRSHRANFSAIVANLKRSSELAPAHELFRRELKS